MADFIESFMQDPNGEDTLAAAKELYAEAEKNVHAAAREKYGDTYLAGGDEFGTEIHSLLMKQLSAVNLNPATYNLLLTNAEHWYVPFEKPEAAICGAISAPLLSAVKEAYEIRQLQRFEQLRKTCVECRDIIGRRISANDLAGDGGFKSDKALQVAQLQREMLDSWITVLNDVSLPVNERFARVQQSIAANRKSFVVTANIPDNLRFQLAEYSEQARLFDHPFLICLQENMFWEATNEAVVFYQRAMEEVRASGMVSPLASKEEKEQATKNKLKDMLGKILQSDLKSEDIENFKNGLAAWKIEREGEQKQWCETVKQVTAEALEERPYYVNCEKLMDACVVYASELYQVTTDDLASDEQREVAQSKLDVVEALKGTLTSQKPASERMKDFASLYNQRSSQRALNASSDTATDKFRKVVDSLLLLLQGRFQKISSLWHKAEGLLDIVDTATKSFLNTRKK